MMSILKLIGRDKELVHRDIRQHEKELSRIISTLTFLVIGGAGSIGQAVSKYVNGQNIIVDDGFSL